MRAEEIEERLLRLVLLLWVKYAESMTPIFPDQREAGDIRLPITHIDHVLERDSAKVFGRHIGVDEERILRGLAQRKSLVDLEDIAGLLGERDAPLDVLQHAILVLTELAGVHLGDVPPNDLAPKEHLSEPARDHVELQATLPSTAGLAVERFLLDLEGFVGGRARKLSSISNLDRPPDLSLRVIDSIHENGAKLVELETDSVPDLRAYQPGMRLVPLVYFRPAVAPRPTVEEKPRVAAGRTSLGIKINVLSAADESPVAGVDVVAFTNFKAREGAQGRTNAKGVATLSFGTSRKKIERLYVFTDRDFWGALRRSVTLTSGTTIRLTPINLAYRDSVRLFYDSPQLSAGAGVSVGIIDTGVGPHPDLAVTGGENTVPGENVNDFGDNGLNHGTHVAGIVAAQGTPPAGIRGVAPGVTLFAYRVFGLNEKRASNYAISKAIDRATSQGCDLINLSLGGGDPDEATTLALQDARRQGTLPIIAAGNDNRAPVSFPASDSMAVGVSAMGRKGTVPNGSVELGDVRAPYGDDRADFIAAFSNIGSEIDLTGPGVGVISAVPGGYATMSGTSMASPAVTGAAARMLSARPDILSMARDQARSDAIAHALLTGSVPRGFGATYEGRGLPEGGTLAS